MPKVKHFRTTTVGSAPSSLLDGEVAINRADSLMFWKDSAGAIRNVNIARGAPKLVLGDFPTGGVIGTAAATIDKYDAITIAQTTAGQTILIPAPSVASDRLIFITNTGVESILLSGQVNPNNFYVAPASTVLFYYASTYNEYLDLLSEEALYSEDFATTLNTSYLDHRLRLQAGEVTNFPAQVNFAVYGADGVSYTMPTRSNAGAGAGYSFSLGNGTTSGVYSIKSGTGASSMFTLLNSSNVQLMTFNNSGSMSIGSQAPTARLHLLAGTATAGTAPLKLTAGTNLTTPENGAIEYDGASYFVTSAGSRKALLTSVAPGTFVVNAGGNTAVKTEAGVGDNRVRFDTGAQANYAAQTNTMILGSDGFSVSLPARTGSAGTGPGITFTAGAAIATGSGGSIVFNPGAPGYSAGNFIVNGIAGNNTGVGSAITLTCGAGGGGTGSQSGGAFTATTGAGSGASGRGGIASITTGAGTAGGYAGDFNVTTGTSVSASGGNINLKNSSAVNYISFINNVTTLARIGAVGMYVGAASSATAKLHIAAGTATASTAPLKLTSGTNLTTPENGAIEYDGTDTFITNSGLRYKFALSDRQTAYSKPHYIATVTGTYAASYTWDINESPNLRLVLTGNITVGITGTPLDGATYNLTLEQGGAGGYLATFSTDFVSRDNSSVQYAVTMPSSIGVWAMFSFYGQSSKMAA